MEDTKKLIEKYKRELVELSRSRKSEERQPQIIGYTDSPLYELGKNPSPVQPDVVSSEEPSVTQPEPREEASPQPPHHHEGDVSEPDFTAPETDEREFTPSQPISEDAVTVPPDTQPQLTPNETDDATQTTTDSEEGGSQNKPIDYPQPDYDSYDDFKAANTGVATLMFRISAAQDSLPIENAKCVITKTINGIIHEIDVLYTDESGKTEKRSLPAPSRSLSQEYDNTVQPFALYDATVTRKGFADVVLTDIPVFDGVLSVQRVSLLPAAYDGDVEIITEVSPDAQ